MATATLVSSLEKEPRLVQNATVSMGAAFVRPCISRVAKEIAFTPNLLR